MLTDPTDTLAYHQSRVLSQHRDMRNVPCAKVATALKAYQAADKSPNTKPETEALWFYGLNHAVALVAARRASLEPLPSDELKLVDDYYTRLPDKAVRAFYYLLLCCIREARHSLSKGSDFPKIEAAFGHEVATLFCKGSGGEGEIHQRFLAKPPKSTIGRLTGALCWQFYNSSWSGGYGGPAWGSIADCLHRFVLGEYSAEMMLDTVWTLQHNNGSVFNKGHFYATWTGTLLRILDVQRSGQIPEAVLTDDQIKKFADAELVGILSKVKHMFPDDLGTYVDWFVVEALGSNKKYPTECAQQVAKHGMSAKADAAQKAKAEKEAAEIKKAKEAAELHEKTHFKVMPGVEIKKIELARAA